MAGKPTPDPHSKPQVLVVDDDPRFNRLLSYNLEQWGYATDVCENAQAMRQALALRAYAVVVLDIRLPDANGVDLLPELAEINPSTKVIMISAHGSIEIAMDAVRLGAYDFVTKPVDLDRCRVSVRNACRLFASEHETELLRAVVTERNRLGAIIGASTPMQVVYQIIANIAQSDCSVLVTGETGTGKELVAAEIHRMSDLGHRDMVTVNCAAIPPELVESEMFGHMKGSFTGATQDKIGAAERANGSTLFLDEIAELNVNLQAKLLRFLQDKQVTRVGDTKSRKTDVRIVTATNRDPADAVDRGELRRDLLYRINAIHIKLPPLRERRSDIPLLAEAFLAEAAAANGKAFRLIDDKARQALMAAEWPGNVRQLKNVITETVLMHQGDMVAADMLPATVHESAKRSGRYRVATSAPIATRLSVRPFQETEKAALQQALYVCRGNITEVAGKLGISRPTLYRKIKQYKLDAASG